MIPVFLKGREPFLLRVCGPVAYFPEEPPAFARLFVDQEEIFATPRNHRQAALLTFESPRIAGTLRAYVEAGEEHRAHLWADKAVREMR